MSTRQAVAGTFDSAAIDRIIVIDGDRLLFVSGNLFLLMVGDPADGGRVFQLHA